MLTSREDWMLFTNTATLAQKAGVPVSKLAALVVKELTDNALDAGLHVMIERQPDGGVLVRDDGPGLPVGADPFRSVCELFSVRRPLLSSKMFRRPSRGALGNGLRVVAGAVTASDGTLVVETRGVRYVLAPQDDGTTRVVSSGPSDYSEGTAVTVRLGASIPQRGETDLAWARLAAGIGPQHYRGSTSCWWYDSASFFDLLRACGDTPVRTLVAEFDAFGKRGGLAALGELPAQCQEVSRAEADALLSKMRGLATRIKATALVSKESAGHARVVYELLVEPGRGEHPALLPVVVDVFAYQNDYEDSVTLMVNGTPATGQINVWRDGKTKIIVHGAGLRHQIEKVSKAHASLTINVTIPFMPITTDGKEPDCARLYEPISTAVRKAMRRLKVEVERREHKDKQCEIVERVLWDCVDEGTMGGKLPLSLRQLFYLVRPHILEQGLELSYGYFARVITTYEAERGEIGGLYRDPRGTLIHPHTRESIQLGTMSVRDYKRPEWLIRNVLYCEKEGLFPLLMAAKWPERNDCALLSSKGMATRAARDVIDLLGDDDQELRFFCIHDADAAGGMIYQTLQGATLARPGRRVSIVNLGLEPWDAIDLGLQVEKFQLKNEGKPPAVAEYVKRQPGRDWQRWLRGNRVELNALRPEAFLEWLDEKFAPHKREKLVPPRRVVEAALTEDVRAAKREELIARILREQNFDARFASEMARVDLELGTREVREALERDPSRHWRDVVRDEARSR